MKREIRFLVVHCTATSPDTKIQDIRRYWKQELGWKKPAYHYIILRNGEIVTLQKEHRLANGVKDFNARSIHIAYIGGINENNEPDDNRTEEQLFSMFHLLMDLTEKYPFAKLMGHRDFPNVARACPSFDVDTWWKQYKKLQDTVIAKRA